MGTLVNVIAILLGSFAGLTFKKLINKNLEKSLNDIMGLAVVVIGFLGVISSCAIVSKGIIETNNLVLMTLSLAFGVMVGEYIDIDAKVNNFIKQIEQKLNLGGFSDGFIPSSVLFCAGAMAIVGALNDGFLHDSSILYTKSILDGIMAIVLSATLGYGVLFSSLSVGVYQGIITVFGIFLSKYFSLFLINNICLVGYVIVICIGLNMMKLKSFKVLNILPGLLVPIFYSIIF